MVAATQSHTHSVGALPAIAHYFERLDLAATIDRIVPWEGDVPLGTLVEILIAHRLLQRLYRRWHLGIRHPAGKFHRTSDVPDSAERFALSQGICVVRNVSLKK